MSLLCFKLNPIASHCLWDAAPRFLLHFRHYSIIQFAIFVICKCIFILDFWGLYFFLFNTVEGLLLHLQCVFWIWSVVIYPSVRWNYKQSWCCFGNYDSKMEKKTSFLFCMYLWWKLVLGVDWNIDPSSKLCIAIFI